VNLLLPWSRFPRANGTVVSGKPSHLTRPQEHVVAVKANNEVDYVAIEEHVVGAPRGNMHITDGVEQTVIKLRSQPLHCRNLGSVVDTLGNDDFGAAAPGTEENRDQFRRMLKVGVHKNNRPSSSILKAGT
jgi:hypothetical protein